MFIEKGENIKEEEVKRAFDRVKDDIFRLGQELSSLRQEIIDIKSNFNELNTLLLSKYNPVNQQINPTYPIIPADTPTVPVEVGGLKDQFLDSSIRNRGVPTDRQTDQQTDIPTDFNRYNEKRTLSKSILDASDILNSLDSLRKDVRLKFKQMTNQEMLVFSTIYQFEEQFPEGVEYSQIASKLGLSASSIRDYTQKLISKGIPIIKEKVNNKKILLKISSKLKDIASLDTILKLRAI